MHALAHAIQVHDIMAIGVRISRRQIHLHFLFACYLTCQAFTWGKHGSFGVVK